MMIAKSKNAKESKTFADVKIGESFMGLGYTCAIGDGSDEEIVFIKINEVSIGESVANAVDLKCGASFMFLNNDPVTFVGKHEIVLSEDVKKDKCNCENDCYCGCGECYHDCSCKECK